MVLVFFFFYTNIYADCGKSTQFRNRATENSQMMLTLHLKNHVNVNSVEDVETGVTLLG